MNNKELKKLSRLELLELLLDISKENNELKEQIEILRTENGTLKDAQAMSETAKQMNDSLVSASRLVEELKAYKAEPVAENTNPANEQKPDAEEKKKRLADRDLYHRILGFFSKNTVLLDIFPGDIRSDLVNRVKSVSDGKKK